MITGFNTDIEHEGVIYHVQTEDKGVSTPLILSLVYNRGTILASKRSPYDDLLLPAFDEKALSERLQKQHKLICAAVRAGRIEDLKRMTREAAASAAPKAKRDSDSPRIKPVVQVKEVLKSSETVISSASQNPLKTETIPAHLSEKENPIENKILEKPLTEKAAVGRVETKIVKPVEEPFSDFPLHIVEEEMIIEAVEIIEDEVILSAEAVEIVSDYVENRQTFDNKLKIELPADITFRSGERKTLSVLVYRGAGNAKNGLDAAHIMIKIFGAAFRPLIFHAKTDKTGTATVHLQLPQFKGGRASILIKAMFDGEETELRRIIER